MSGRSVRFRGSIQRVLLARSRRSTMTGKLSTFDTEGLMRGKVDGKFHSFQIMFWAYLCGV